MDEYYTKSELRALENQETLGKMILTSPQKFLAHYMPELESCRAPEAELIFQSLEPIKKGDDIYDIIVRVVFSLPYALMLRDLSTDEHAEQSQSVPRLHIRLYFASRRRGLGNGRGRNVSSRTRAQPSAF